MRELKTKDMYLLSEILDKMDLAENFELKEEISAKELSLQLIYTVVRKMHKAPEEINKLLCAVTELTLAEVEEMPLREAKEILTNVLQQDGVPDFFD